MALEKQQPFGFRCGRALRAEYWLGHAPEKERIDSLRKIGIQLSRTSYYDAIRTARVHVAAWLRISA